MTTAEQAKTAALDDEPYLVKDPVVVVDAEGNPLPSKRETIALCRCGTSTNKPFCDDTYSKIGSRAAERAIRREKEERGREPKAYRS
jgi:CDGSH-type Zn-finger protein